MSDVSMIFLNNFSQLVQAYCQFVEKKKNPAGTAEQKKGGAAAAGPGGVAAKALQQLKQQGVPPAPRSREDIEGQISRTLDSRRSQEQGAAQGGSTASAVGDLIQEVQRHSQLLEGDPRSLPHQMILVRSLDDNERVCSCCLTCTE